MKLIHFFLVCLMVSISCATQRYLDPTKTYTLEKDPRQRFLKVEGNIVTDRRTGLTWLLPRDWRTYTWREAANYISELNNSTGFFGAKWRFPTPTELNSLHQTIAYDMPGVQPCVAAPKLGLRNVFCGIYWAGVPHPNTMHNLNTAYVKVYHFGQGSSEVGPICAKYSHWVLPVKR